MVGRARGANTIQRLEALARSTGKKPETIPQTGKSKEGAGTRLRKGGRPPVSKSNTPELTSQKPNTLDFPFDRILHGEVRNRGRERRRFRLRVKGRGQFSY